MQSILLPSRIKSMTEKERIFLDHAAATPVDERVEAAMRPYIRKYFANPGGIYQEGVVARSAVEKARRTIADLLSARAEEIIFTSGGTEANNLAIFGFAQMLKSNGIELEKTHWITTAIEHPSVLYAFRELEMRGAEVTYLGVDRSGAVSLEDFQNALSSNTVFISIMYANNEIGTVQPISEIARKIKKTQQGDFFTSNKPGFQFPIFHCDASQVPAYLDCNVQKLGIDLLVLDGQKIYGPKGIGMLYHRRGIPISRILWGGKQEGGLRPGTENVPDIVVFSRALALAVEWRENDARRLFKITGRFIERIEKMKLETEFNGSRENRLPNTVNFSFPGIDNEWLVIQLDSKGIAAGTRSACQTGEEPGSYVVSALGKNKAYSTSSVRFTAGRGTVEKDLEYTAETISEILAKK